MPIKNLYDSDTLDHFLNRVNKLAPDTQRLWGKMSVSQMMAHCTAAIEMQMGKPSASVGIMGRIIGRLVKGKVVSDKPFEKGLPTSQDLLTTTDKEFNAEKERLIATITKLCRSNPSVFENRKHPFFGKMTPHEWNMLASKHLDHHLQQFGV